jgi:uncharacterized protein YutE (UPF0331/DUF86 family)
MPSLNKSLLHLKLADLELFLAELEPLAGVDYKTYQADYIKLYAIEKLIELIVEIASDINRIFIEAAGRKPLRPILTLLKKWGKLGSYQSLWFHN